jgi:hypothetical protein
VPLQLPKDAAAQLEQAQQSADGETDADALSDE